MAERGLGRPESVLTVAFVEKVTMAVIMDEDEDSDILPFIEWKLPTKEAVLKLYVFLRDLEGNKRISTNVLIDKVTDYVLQYWKQANIKTIQKKNAVNKVLVLLKEYFSTYKNKRETDSELMKKENFDSELKKLFDISSKCAEKVIKLDRLLKDEDKEEDLIFLTDQKEGRMMDIGEGDMTYTEKKELRMKAAAK